MVQFYLLAVILNILGGLFLSSELLEDRFPVVKSLRESLSLNNSTRVVAILIALVTALFKILSVTEGDVPVVGDLLPALSLIALAFVVFLEFYRERASVETSFMEKLNSFFLEKKTIIGIAAMAIGIAHFLFPSVLFL